MKLQINSLVATLVSKKDAPKGSVGAIIGEKEEGDSSYFLVELFTTSIPHLQLFYSKDEIYVIQQLKHYER